MNGAMLCCCRFDSRQHRCRAQPVAGGRLGGSRSQQLRGQRLAICSQTPLRGAHKQARMLIRGQRCQEMTRCWPAGDALRWAGTAEQVTREGRQFGNGNDGSF